jgi:hypothetical protein
MCPGERDRQILYLLKELSHTEKCRVVFRSRFEGALAPSLTWRQRTIPGAEEGCRRSVCTSERDSQDKLEKDHSDTVENSADQMRSHTDMH